MRRDTTWWRYNLIQLGIVVVTIVALSAIVASLPQGLLGNPDMHVTGNQSYGNRLSWFADQSVSALPVATAVSVPTWIYKTLILAWSLWLSLALLRWLPWTWQCFAREGFFRSQPRPGDPPPDSTDQGSGPVLLGMLHQVGSGRSLGGPSPVLLCQG